MNEQITLKTLIKLALSAVGLFSTVLGIYSYYDNKEANLEFSILSESNVFDLNANISKIDIIYDNSSLKKLNNNLKIFNIEIRNTGQQNILKDQYDDNEPLGIIVNNGSIIEIPELVQASSFYLKRNVKPKLLSVKKIVFSKVIMEEDEFFTIKLLVLHSNGSQPSISSTGKIAGIKNISVVDKIPSSKKMNFEDRIQFLLEEATSGDFYVQMMRIVLYFFLTIASVATVIFIVVSLSDLREKMKKNKILNSLNHLDREKVEIVYDLVIKYDLNFIEGLDHKISNDNVDRRTLNKEISASIRNSLATNINEIEDKKRFETYVMNNSNVSFVDSLLKEGVIVEKENKIYYADGYDQVFKSVIIYCRRNKIYG